jgi:hypothetical protein
VLIPPIFNDIEQTLAQEGDLVSWLAAFPIKSTLLASTCTGAFLLAETGVLPTEQGDRSVCMAPMAISPLKPPGLAGTIGPPVSCALAVLHQGPVSLPCRAPATAPIASP